MIKRMTTLIVLFLLNKTLTYAQMQKEDFTIAQSMVNKQKRIAVCKNLEIDDSPKYALFWKLYDEYEEKRSAFMQERYSLLNEYSLKYKGIEDKTAASLSERFIENVNQMDLLSKRYFKKFKKLVGGVQATTLFQIEFYTQTMVQADILNQVPIIGELEKLAKEREQTD